MDGIRPIQATYTQLIPFSELANGEASSIRNNFIRKMVDVASGELKMTADRLVVRDIRPKDDLDYTYQTWSEETGSTVGTYETMTTGTNTTDRWIGFFGIKTDPNPPVSMIKFNIGGSDRAIWVIEGLKTEDDMTGFSPGGVVIPPSQPYTISRYVIQASYNALIVLKGIVVEPRGKVISP